MKNEIMKKFDDQIRAELRSMPQKVSKYMESATLSILGLEKRGCDYEIDHCNSRNSVLIDVFRDMARAEARKIAKTYQPSKEDVVGFKEAFRKEFVREFGYIARDLGKQKAIEEARKISEKMKFDIKKVFKEETGKDIPDGLIF